LDAAGLILRFHRLDEILEPLARLVDELAI
jgi:hypothetical protein